MHLINAYNASQTRGERAMKPDKTTFPTMIVGDNSKQKQNLYIIDPRSGLKVASLFEFLSLLRYMCTITQQPEIYKTAVAYHLSRTTNKEKRERLLELYNEKSPTEFM